jgi:UDP-3-O-[3-hydroxymyristoyl] glucosamine N-acyltransferase
LQTSEDKPGDPRFFKRSGPHALGAIAAVAGAITDDPARLFSGIAPLQSAGPEDVSFLDNRRYAGLLEMTRAGAVILAPEFAPRVPEGSAALVTKNPYVGWARVAAMFHPAAVAVAGIHPSAIVDPSARIDPGAEIGPGSVIGADAVIGAGSIVGALCVIGAGVVIGRNCRIHAHVTVSHALIGDHVTLYPGARIGQDGFGFAISETGFTPVPQLGRVIIGDGAEIGANTTIDRGSATDTVIGPGVHIDNQVMIAHNVTIGAGAVLVAQSGVSGSTSIGPRAVVAAQAGLAGHLNIGAGARIGAQAGVMNDVAAGQDVLGAPSRNAKQFFREVITLRRLAEAGRHVTKEGVQKGGGAQDVKPNSDGQT